MASRLCCTPDRGQRRQKAEPDSTEKQRCSKRQCLTDTTGAVQVPSSVLCPASSGAQGSQEVRSYRPRGTCGTFAGRRPPKGAERLQQFEVARAAHYKRLAEKNNKRQSTHLMVEYRDFVRHMLPLETEGNGAERLRNVAAKWKHRASKLDEITHENRMVV